MQSMKNATK